MEKMLTFLVNAAFLLPASLAMNPMDLYVDKPEGFSLANPSNGQYFHCELRDYHHTVVCSTDAEYKQKNTRHTAYHPQNGTYMLGFYTTYDNNANAYMQVLQNGDGTVSLRCKGNGNFLDQTLQVTSEGWNNGPCTQPGICPTCKFILECGSIVPIHLEILDIRWGERDGEVMANPSVVATDKRDNWSNVEVISTFSVSYTSTKSDTTVWQHAWGFEFSASATVECGIPFIGGGSVTTSATASYDGSVGAEHTVEEEQSFSDTKEMSCPPHSRCLLQLIIMKLDNVDMPFTATVRRNKEDGTLITWEEEGTWYGVTVFAAWSEFCTEDLITGEYNCPSEYKTPLQPVSRHN